MVLGFPILNPLDDDIMKKHMTKHTGRILFQCGKCEFEATKQAFLEEHIDLRHTTKPSPVVIKRKCEKCEGEFDAGFIFEAHKCIITSKYHCEQCTFTAVTLAELLEHMVAKHTGELKKHLEQINQEAPSDSSKIKCDQCHFMAVDTSTMGAHTRTEHSKVSCHICDHRAVNEEKLKDHMYNIHPEVVMIHTMAKQMNIMSDKIEEFEKFGLELTNVLKRVLDNQNNMKQELFIIRNKQAEEQKKTPEVVPSVKPSPAPSITPRRTYAEASSSTSFPKTSTPSNASHSNAPRVNKHQQENQKMLFIGDSISSNVEISMLENATKARIKTAKAYSAAFDTETNIAKQAAMFPASNFTDVVSRELKNGKFTTVLLQAGSVDITNLNTKENPEKYTEYFKQVAVMSATNLFQVAENAFKDSPSTSKVIIMKQIPRYDPLEVDPLSLKPSLSLLFNKTLTKLWMDSSLKDKIFIGTHNIECNGAIREARYRHTKSGKFDGIHLYGSSGRKAYTRSVLNILQSAKITSPSYHGSCEQFIHQSRTFRANFNQWQGRKIRPSQAHSVFTIPTQNRFDALYSQGNW